MLMLDCQAMVQTLAPNSTDDERQKSMKVLARPNQAAALQRLANHWLSLNRWSAACLSLTAICRRCPFSCSIVMQPSGMQTKAHVDFSKSASHFLILSGAIVWWFLRHVQPANYLPLQAKQLLSHHKSFRSVWSVCALDNGGTPCKCGRTVSSKHHL